MNNEICKICFWWSGYCRESMPHCDKENGGRFKFSQTAIFSIISKDMRDKYTSEIWHAGETVGKIFAEIDIEDIKEDNQKIKDDLKYNWRLLHEIRNRLDILERKV